MHRILALVLLVATPLAAAPLTVTFADGSARAVAWVAGEEEMSAPMRFRIGIEAGRRGDAPLAIDAIACQEVTLTIENAAGPVRRFNGVCSRISQGSSGDLSTVEIELLSNLTRLDRTPRSRIFQELSATDIVRNILGEGGITAELRLVRSYPRRTYVTQYQESDLQFISRLMEEEEIYYFSSAGESIVIGDATEAYDAIAGPLRFQQSATKGEVIDGLSRTRDLDALTLTGSSRVPSLAAGHRFTIAGAGAGFDGEYVVTSVKHSARDANGKLEYSNTFTCIPAAVAFRPPRRTPRPVIVGVQTAAATGEADPFGRIKVKFPFDANHSSVWIRVSTPFAMPEVDDEVLVAFEHGDPDRPFIIGTLP